MDDRQLKMTAQQFGTPMYILDADVLKKRIDYLKRKLPKNAALCYAVKANTFIIKELCGQVSRFEVCSPGELAICCRLGVPLEQVVLSGVYKTPSVMEKLFKDRKPIGIYTIESMTQYVLLSKLAETYGVKIRILLRLTSGNQFGMGEEDVLAIIRQNQGNTLVDIEGIQYFSGTQKTSIKRLRRELLYVDSFIQKLETEEKFHVCELEFGPGLPVAYFQSEEFQEDEFLDAFAELLEGIESKVRLTLELGRSIAASCGSYLTSVVDTKHSKNQNYAIVDGGMHQLVYYGQSMAMKQPYCHILGEQMEGEVKEWHICGSLCTINDILVKQFPSRALKAGDILVFENTGAYSMTEGIALFLSRDLPKILLIDESGACKQLRNSMDTYVINTASY